MTRTAELAESIKEKINEAYEAGRIQTMDDFDKVFLESWNAFGIQNSPLRGSTRASVQYKNPLYIALRRQEKEVHWPITKESLIDHLPISTKVYNSLYRGGIRAVKHILDMLLEKGQDGLFEIAHIGPESVKEIYEALEWAGIEIPPQPEPKTEGTEKEKSPVLDDDYIRDLVYSMRDITAPKRGAARTIILDGDETFKTEILSGNSGEIIIIGHKRLIIRARRIVVEAFG